MIGWYTFRLADSYFWYTFRLVSATVIKNNGIETFLVRNKLIIINIKRMEINKPGI